MKYTCCAAFVICLLSTASQSVGDDRNWSQWRGPAGSGVTTTARVVTQWGPDQNVKWRIDLPEPGNSTPIVWEDKVFFTQPLSETNERSLFCVDRNTGREIWRRGVVDDRPEASHKTNPYCSASPVTDGKRVIAWFGSAGLVCWDLAGNELWRRDLGPQEHMWGYGTSPILHDDLCILAFGPGNHEFLLAVDKTSGETRWVVDALDDAAERALSGPENDGNANDFTSEKQRSERLRGAWNTPILIEVDGHWELVAVLPRRVSAFDPSTGDRLWTCGGAAPLAYASPMESDGVVVALGGYGGASLAVRAGGRGDVTQTHRLWHKPRDSGWLGTGVAHEGLIYICGINGVLSCLDVQTGEQLWKDRAGEGGTWSSITQAADGRMFLLTKSGTTTVFQPDAKQLTQLAENELKETTNASVVLAGEEILIRTDEALWCIAEPSL
ncbi:serine/threonine protein kinase [Rhodopirellula sp. SM50]|nr:PQQ-binding-like beta-propeller repeat protein [Rhodopirellula sp. SM50]PAY15851.1 serine/threonine protein kinase [Rhodopirellula sp. SM50]